MARPQVRCQRVQKLPFRLLFRGLIPRLDIYNIEVQLPLGAAEGHAGKPPGDKVGFPDRFDSNPNDLVQKRPGDDHPDPPTSRDSAWLQ